MRWANFLSMFHFHFMHTPGNKNVVADALSRRPRVNAVTTIHHEDLSSMPELYEKDEDFKEVWAALQEGKSAPSFSIRDGYLYHNQAICVVTGLRTKVMSESHAPPYAGHRGIMSTTSALE